MKRKPVVLGSLALAVALAPAHAGTVYVPFATQQQIGGVQYHTEVVVSNPDGVARRFSTVFLASGQNGLAAGKSSPSIAVPADGSFRLTAVAPAGRDGMLEVSGAPQLAVAARLVAVAAGGEVLSSTPLPAVGSGNMVPAGGVAHVQGIARSAAGTSQRFGLINLGDGAAHCTAAVFRVDGSLLGDAFGFTIPARSHWIVPTSPLEASALAPRETFTDARLEVTCDQSFYPYVLQLGPAAGQAAFLAPSGSLQSLLVAAASSRRGSGGDGGGDEGGGGGGGGNGGGGGTGGGGTGGTGGTGGSGGGAVAGQDSLAFAGAFLNAQDGGSYRAFELPLRAGVRYRSVAVDFDLYLNQWPGGLFTAVTSLRRSDRTLYYGLILRGDKAKTMIDLGHEQMAKHDGAWKQRTQYHLRFVTDAPSRTVTLQVFQGSALIETVVGNLTAWDLSAGANQKMSVDFGIARIADGAYFPPNGWRYSNLTVQAVPF